MTEESTLPDAIDQLYRAVGELFDEQKQYVQGRVRVAPSWWDRLTEAVAATGLKDGTSRAVAKSRPLCWADALDLKVRIEDRAKSWIGGDSVPGRLRALASRRWRPQDTEAVQGIAAEVQSWRLAVTALVEPSHIKSVAAACPQCGERWVYRMHAGERVRQPALQLEAATGCLCQGCRAFWPPEKYLFLCRLLGFDLPAGIVA